MQELGETRAIYHHDDTAYKADVKVTASIPFSTVDEPTKALFIGAAEGAHLLVTAATIFYAKGGGQPNDTGTMTCAEPASTFTVTSVRKLANGAILHLGTYAGPVFGIGSSVVQEIDVAKRLLHSRIHDGGHIVSTAIRSLEIPDLSEAKAQHWPEAAYVDFKGVIPGDRKADIERAANQIVEDDLPITVHWWTPEELSERSWTAPEAEGDATERVRAVDIQGKGAYMCGGTHVRTTAAVGAIRIRKLKKQQGLTRVSYELV